MFTSDDYRYMARAIQLAGCPVQSPHPNPRVGCVIVKNQQIIGEGFHQKAGEAHAEIHALRQVGDDAQNATVYVSLEPCAHTGKTPPCADALIKAKVARVVVAMQDPNPKVAGKGIAMLQQAGIVCESGLLEPQAKALNPGFIKRMLTGRPWVRSKIAMSVDGRTALANGESQWITGPAARQDVQLWRGNADAILTGSGTVLLDNPKLTVRNIAVENVRQPLRVIIDSQLRTPVDAKIFFEPGRVLIAHIQATVSAQYPEHVELVRLPSNDKQIDLEALLVYLAQQQINEIHVEAGASLNGALLSQNLMDELVIYMAPVLLGDKARPLFELETIHSMQDKHLLDCVDVRQVGKDTRFIYRRAN